MIRYLLLSIRFLSDRYHGLTASGDKIEWPPSPFRLFQAMVAGNQRGTIIPESLKRALQWLEELEPPLIIAPKVMNGQTLLTYVLNNEWKISKTPKTIRPTILYEDRLVQYVWRFESSKTCAIENAVVLLKSINHINALGWGIDLAVGHGEIVERLPEHIETRITYKPETMYSHGGIDLRVPKQGSLKSLECVYADFLERYSTQRFTRLESAGAVYEPQPYIVGASRPYVVFRFVNMDGDTISFRRQLIKSIVGMIRNLANDPSIMCSLGTDIVNRKILGHPKQGVADRLSILPLPTIRNGPTDGRIRRVMLAQPIGSDGELVHRLGQFFDGQQLIPRKNEYRCRSILLEKIDRRNHDAVLPYYTGISHIWATVTPMLLPGYDDRKTHRGNHQKLVARAKQLVCKALRQSNIDNKVQIELSRAPYWSGSSHVYKYIPREKLEHYPRWHVRITFDKPLTGPLAIGAGRHCGLGIFAKIE